MRGFYCGWGEHWGACFFGRGAVEKMGKWWKNRGAWIWKKKAEKKGGKIFRGGAERRVMQRLAFFGRDFFGRKKAGKKKHFAHGAGAERQGRSANCKARGAW